MSGYARGGQLLLGDLGSERVDATVQFGFDGEPGAVGGGRDELHHGFMADQGTAPPVQGDRGEQAMLDFYLHRAR